jgi:hypothetical protein
MIRPEWRIERGGLLTPRCGQRGPRRTLFEALMQAIALLCDPGRRGLWRSSY